MVNFSCQISNLLLVLITLKVTQNGVEAGKISSLSKSSSNESSIASGKLLNVDSENLRKSEANVESEAEISAPSTALDRKPDDSRGSTVYSYFYVGRWAWHIPLWFTLWFVFYISFNVVRAIQGHSVRTSKKYRELN